MLNTHRMGRKKLGRERINITLPEGMSDEATAAAADQGWDRSRLIEELLRTYLKKWRKEKEEEKGGKRK